MNIYIYIIYIIHRSHKYRYDMSLCTVFPYRIKVPFLWTLLVNLWVGSIGDGIVFGGGCFTHNFAAYPPLRTNISPDKPLEKENNLPNHHFQVLWSMLRGCKACLNMIFLFPRWDMLVSCRIFFGCGPLRKMPVTTRTLPFLLGFSYKPFFATGILGEATPFHISEHVHQLLEMMHP